LGSKNTRQNLLEKAKKLDFEHMNVLADHRNFSLLVNEIPFNSNQKPLEARRAGRRSSISEPILY
jgi:hypothetical protein